MRRSQASAWPEVATFLIKRKWPKIDRGGPRAPSEAKGSAGGLRLGPPLVSWTVPSLRSPPGKAEGSSAKRRASSGGCRPGLPLDSRPNPGLHWPPGRIGAPCAAGPGRGASAQPATGRGRFWADVSPLGRLGPLRRRLSPRGAGLRRQGRHPRKANTERRSGRGTRVSGVIPFGFCCLAAIKYPAGAVSSLLVESLAVVQPAATGGGGNGSGTERRLVLAVGFPKGCPLWSVFGYFLLIKKVT